MGCTERIRADMALLARHSGGVVVRQISDVSLGWLGVMYDFLNDEDTF